ncbi:unnamed protein product [Amoebophrya sp. A120]|nr:unnamed protein product [Amoebophrya sp. A120]|eukprot:GSA120T00004123001.1
MYVEESEINPGYETAGSSTVALVASTARTDEDKDVQLSSELTPHAPPPPQHRDLLGAAPDAPHKHTMGVGSLMETGRRILLTDKCQTVTDMIGFRCYPGPIKYGYEGNPPTPVELARNAPDIIVHKRGDTFECHTEYKDTECSEKKHKWESRDLASDSLGNQEKWEIGSATHVLLHYRDTEATFQPLKCSDDFMTKWEAEEHRKWLKQKDEEYAKWDVTFAKARERLLEETHNALEWGHKVAASCRYAGNTKIVFDDYQAENHSWYRKGDAADCMIECEARGVERCWGVAIKVVTIPKGSEKGCVFLKDECVTEDENLSLQSGSPVWKIAMMLPYGAQVEEHDPFTDVEDVEVEDEESESHKKVEEASTSTVEPSTGHIGAAPPSVVNNMLGLKPKEDVDVLVVIALVLGGLVVIFCMLFCYRQGYCHRYDREDWQDDEYYDEQSHLEASTFLPPGDYGYYDQADPYHSGAVWDDNDRRGSERGGNYSSKSTRKKDDDDKAPIDGFMKWLFG